METRLLILNADPVFQDRALGIFDVIDDVETRIVRTMAEAVFVLLAENFDGFVVEGEARSRSNRRPMPVSIFLRCSIVCLAPKPHDSELVMDAQQQKITVLSNEWSERSLRRHLRQYRSLCWHANRGAGRRNRSLPFADRQSQSIFRRGNSADELPGPAQRPLHFQIGAREQRDLSAARLLRHAVLDRLEGEAAVAEIFRWRQGRFYFEEGIISQVQTVDRPWAHLLIDNLQKLDETLELVSGKSQR